MSFPRLPAGIIYPEDVEVEVDLEELWRDVCQELTNPAFKGRSHNRKTYDSGCGGPLCRKAQRDYARRRTTVSNPRAFHQVVDPVLMYFESVAKERIEEAESELLTRLLG